MTAAKKRTRARRPAKRPRAGAGKGSAGQRPIKEQVRDALAWLQQRGTLRDREGMARYGIVAANVYGVKVSTIQQLAKELGRDHELAIALWETGWYEARLLAAFVAEPSRTTPAQMDRWARTFENWADCDHACFHLFDRTPHAWRKIEQWAGRREEFVKRGAFALLASVALHDKGAPDQPFLRGLELIEREAADERNFVKKGVNWALRGIGRRNVKLNAAATVVARRLAASTDAAARWVGKDALRALVKGPVAARKR